MALELNDATAEGDWFIELDQGWALWIVDGMPFQGYPDAPFRYRYGKTEFEAQFHSETEGIQTNLSTGKTRLLLKQSAPPTEASGTLKTQQQSPVTKPRGPSAAAKPLTTKAENLPTCYFLASNGASYDGEFEWLIELEKGWTPWMPENQPFDGSTDQPLRYTLGRYDFEVNFADEDHGTQTNLATGKVRRIQRRHKADPMPAWEGTGIRRRAAPGATAELASAPASSEASAAQARRADRRAAGGYGGALSSSPVPKKASTLTDAQRPRVSQSALSESQRGGNAATVPRYMRQLKSKLQA